MGWKALQEAVGQESVSKEQRAVAFWVCRVREGSLGNSHGQSCWFGALINQSERSLFQIAGERERCQTQRGIVAPCASVAASKMVWEEVVVVVVIDPRDLQGLGVGEGWVSLLIEQLGWPQSPVSVLLKFNIVSLVLLNWLC